MAGSVNKVILIGNLGADPEIRRLPSGDPVVNMRLATSEQWRDRQTGERREKTEWHNVVIFNDNLAKVAENYLKKGSKVYIEGQLQTRKWTDQSGQDRYTTEVVLQKFRGELTMLDRPDPRTQAPLNAFRRIDMGTDIGAPVFGGHDGGPTPPSVGDVQAVVLPRCRKSGLS